MTEANSLCRVDWKLGQALMPEHFLRQEVSLREEWGQRFSQQPLPMWGVFSISWDQRTLNDAGRVLLTRLELVFPSGVLVDIPGNAEPAYIDLPEPAGSPVDVFIHLDPSPAVVRGGGPDEEGGLIELRQQKLVLSLSAKRSPQPGLHLARFRPKRVASGEDSPEEEPEGWEWDDSYVPPLTSLWGLRPFAEQRFVQLQRLLARWLKMLRSDAVENSLAVHKRVEAQMCLRGAYGLQSYMHQTAPSFGEEAQGSDTGSGLEPAIRTHPFDLYQRLVRLYLEVFTFRATPLQLLKRREPAAMLYRHGDLAQCYKEVEAAISHELERPGPGTPQWSFVQDLRQADRYSCQLPEGLEPASELYFLVQFEGRNATPAVTDQGLDQRLLGLRLAAPDRLASVERRVLPGIPLERVRLVPFPHNFDPTSVQFYRLGRGAELNSAHQAGAISYTYSKQAISRSFIYCPDVAGA